MRKQLTDLCTIQYGYAFDSESFTTDNSFPPLVRIRDVKRGFSETFYSGDYPPEYVIHSGDLLVGMDGEFNIARWRSGDALLNQRVCKISATRGTDEEYLRFALQKALKEIEDRTAFVTVKHLSAKELNKLELDIPDMGEQARIAQILCKLERVISMREAELSALDDLIKARFVEMFGECRESISAGDLMHNMRNGVSPSTSGKHQEKVLTLSAITQGQFDPNMWKDGIFDAIPAADKRICSTDFYMCRGNGNKSLVGAGVYSADDRDDLVFPDTVIAASVDTTRVCLPYLFVAWMQPGIREQIEAGARTTNGTYKINQQIISKIKVPLPPLPEQQQFATFVAQIDKSKFGEIRFLFTDYIYNKKYGDRKMDITFLIGNGFDIHMGIASAYKKVEAHYANLKKADPRLQAFQKSIAENGDYWSNFEFAIGQYTDRFQDDRQADFQICLDDFTEELIRYLQAEESKIDYDLCGEEIQKEFIRSISKYDESIPNRYRNTINAIISKNGGVNFRFISFNYTHILDQCLERAFKNNAVVGNHAMKGTGYNHIVNRSVLHIHGDLPGPIIMGVDNPGQIANKKWSGQRRFRQKLEKPAINARAGSLVDDEVTKLINGSNIICVYGMSIGETDKTWWKLIGSWLQGADRRLVLFGHSNSYSQVGFTHQRQFDIQNNLIDKFLDLAEIQGADRDALENKIIAVINPNLFNINLVQLSEQMKKVNEIETEAKVKELTAAYEKHQKLAELTTVT